MQSHSHNECDLFSVETRQTNVCQIWIKVKKTLFIVHFTWVDFVHKSIWFHICCKNSYHLVRNYKPVITTKLCIMMQVMMCANIYGDKKVKKWISIKISSMTFDLHVSLPMIEIVQLELTVWFNVVVIMQIRYINQIINSSLFMNHAGTQFSRKSVYSN